jgi:hypothetical protein
MTNRIICIIACSYNAFPFYVSKKHSVLVACRESLVSLFCSSVVSSAATLHVEILSRGRVLQVSREGAREEARERDR